MPAIVNPNELTSTRIPNAYISTTTSNSPGASNNVLRKVNNTNRSKIVIGPTKGYQYSKAQNWRAGLTPYDNGYYNDGVSQGNGGSDAPSRYYDANNPLVFEWWHEYVIYNSGGSTTGPNGNDNLEIIVASSSVELVSITNRIFSSSASDEASALAVIANSNDSICVNTHYPNIPIYDNVGVNGVTYSLKLLHDFGFIPSYPRGGTVSYDISNNVNHNMILTSGTNITYDSQGTLNLNCLGGCLKFANNTSNDYAYIPYQSDLYPRNTTVSVWVNIPNTNSNKVVIDTTGGWTSGSGVGYQLWIIAGYPSIVVLTTSGAYTASSAIQMNIGEWYNITFTISTDSGNTITNVRLVVSDSSSYGLDTVSGTQGGGQGTNTNDFIVGVRLVPGGGLANPLGARLSSIAVYEGALELDDIESLHGAYTKCNPLPFNPGNLLGRYSAY
jgi:hypothetical protein